MLRNSTLRFLPPNPKLEKKNDSSHDIIGKLSWNLYNFCLYLGAKDSRRQEINVCYISLRLSLDEVGNNLQLIKDLW